MPKKLRTYPLFVAPGISGVIKNGGAYVYDEKNDVTLNPNFISDKIKIYERQVKGWFLDRAINLSRNRNNGFIILMICFSYLEGVEQYKIGRSSEGRSAQFFVKALNRIYPKKYSNRQLRELYSQARCGLFHNGMTESKIIYNYSLDSPISFPDKSTISINPKLLLRDIRKDFRDYINNLGNDIVLQNNFDRMFNIR